MQKIQPEQLLQQQQQQRDRTKISGALDMIPRKRNLNFPPLQALSTKIMKLVAGPTRKCDSQVTHNKFVNNRTNKKFFVKDGTNA